MKDLKGAEAVAEIIKLDLRDYYDTDKIYINVIATDINTYEVIVGLYNDNHYINFDWDIEKNLLQVEEDLICNIDKIILNVYKRK